MNPKNEGISILILIVMGLASLFVSFMGFMIFAMGEACCHTSEPGGVAYAGFASSITLTLVVVLIYAFWSPAKPLIFWIWAGMIVGFLTAMNIRTPHHPGSTYLPLGQTIRNLLAWPLTWALVGFVALSHIEARFGARTWGKRGIQGA